MFDIGAHYHGNALGEKFRKKSKVELFPVRETWFCLRILEISGGSMN
jgi:hypothetical protein